MPPLPPKSVICKSPDPGPAPHLPIPDCSILIPIARTARFRPRFLERRKAGLSYFLKYVSHIVPIATPRYCLTIFSCILLNPEFAGSPVLKEFLFS
jgi:hypothetical protein